MKKTIKQWCKQYEINWLGQGSMGEIRYDWKLVLGKGRTAIFSSSVQGAMPEIHTINGREVLVFPNVNKPRNGGKISDSAFHSIIDWVNTSLDGNQCEYAPHKAIEPTVKTSVESGDVQGTAAEL